jgi:hypothetical protein
MDGSRRKEAKPLTFEEARAKLAQGLKPGEDILFYDMNRFGNRRPAEPSEVEVYEPPRPLPASEPVAGDAPDQDGPEDKVILAPEPTTQVVARRRQLGRHRTRELAISVGMIAFSTCAAWWVLSSQSQSSAQRKVTAPTAAALVPPVSAATHAPADPAAQALNPPLPMPVPPAPPAPLPSEPPKAHKPKDTVHPLPTMTSEPAAAPAPKRPTEDPVDPEAAEFLNHSYR